MNFTSTFFKMTTRPVTVGLLSFCLVAGCKRTVASSTVKLAGGVWDASGQYDGIYGYGYDKVTDPKFMTPRCTGVAISSSVLLTAAHCVDGHYTSDLWLVDALDHLITNSAGKPILGYGIGSDCYQTNGKIAFECDVALLRYPPGTFTKTYQWSDAQPQAGDNVTLVGFGFDSDDAGADPGRQVGTSQIHAIIGGSTLDLRNQSMLIDYSMLWTVGQPVRGANRGANGGVGAATVKGDSGGPLLKDGVLLGVLNGGGPFQRDASDTQIDSVYANLHYQKNIDFLAHMRAVGWDVPPPPNTAWVDGPAATPQAAVPMAGDTPSTGDASP